MDALPKRFVLFCQVVHSGASLVLGLASSPSEARTTQHHAPRGRAGVAERLQAIRDGVTEIAQVPGCRYGASLRSRRRRASSCPPGGVTAAGVAGTSAGATAASAGPTGTTGATAGTTGATAAGITAGTTAGTTSGITTNRFRVSQMAHRASGAGAADRHAGRPADALLQHQLHATATCLSARTRRSSRRQPCRRCSRRCLLPAGSRRS